MSSLQQIAWKPQRMIARIADYLFNLRDRQRLCIALSKGSAMMHARNVDLAQPATWEFSGFSQNGEDGIIDVLRRQLLSPNRYFVEIGAADGLENNTAWLLVAEKYSGIMIDGDDSLIRRAKRIVEPYSIGAQCDALFVTRESVEDVKKLTVCLDPDVLSLDIDGNDYYIIDSMFKIGFRPKIIVVEYNSVYGPELAVTIKYQQNFNYRTAHWTELYYGVSVAGWRKFFSAIGYQFITVERNGVNAFFVEPSQFTPEFLDGVRGLEFAGNRYQQRKFRMPDSEQFILIADQEFFAL